MASLKELIDARDAYVSIKNCIIIAQTNADDLKTEIITAKGLLAEGIQQEGKGFGEGEMEEHSVYIGKISSKLSSALTFCNDRISYYEGEIKKISSISQEVSSEEVNSSAPLSLPKKKKPNSRTAYIKE